MDDLDDYKPSGGPSTVQFVVVVSADGDAADERVVLKGNLPALGAWERSIPLARSADDPCIWEVEVELPIGLAVTHKMALFEFRYAIEKADGVGEAVEEGGVSRRHLEMHSRFSHSFKSLIDPDNGRPTVGDRVRLAKGVGSKGALKVGAIGEILQDDRDHLPYKIAGKDKAFSESAFAALGLFNKLERDTRDALLIDVQGGVAKEEAQRTTAGEPSLFIQSPDVVEVHLTDEGADLVASLFAEALLNGGF